MVVLSSAADAIFLSSVSRFRKQSVKGGGEEWSTRRVKGEGHKAVARLHKL